MSAHDSPRIPPALPGDPDAAPGPEPLRPGEPPRHALPRRRRRRFLFWSAVLVLPLLLTPPLAVLALRWLPPATSAFMLQSPAQPVYYQWVPAERIAEPLRRAVVAAEDQKFWTHWGFDLVAIAEAMEHNEKNRRKRGASTITQQTAKNLFLWPSRSYLRKGLEASFTVLLELLLPKARILEVYLNIAEFGPGIYGAEAAARKFFGKSARSLSAAEAAQLAAVLPNPRKWRADQPGPYVQSRTDWILGQMGEPPRYAAIPESEPEEELPGEAPDDGASVTTDPYAPAPLTPPPDGEARSEADAPPGEAAPQPVPEPEIPEAGTVETTPMQDATPPDDADGTDGTDGTDRTNSTGDAPSSDPATGP